MGKKGGRVDESAAEGGQLVEERVEVGGCGVGVGSRGRRVGTVGTPSERPTQNVGRASARRYFALAAGKRGRSLAVLWTALGGATAVALFVAAAVLDVVVEHRSAEVQDYSRLPRACFKKDLL